MRLDPIAGSAPRGWRSLTIGAACDENGGVVQTGPFGSQLHAADYVPDGVPSIMPKDIKTDRVSTEDIARVRPEDVERLSTHKVEVGDVVYSRRGDVERRALITTREAGWLCGTGCLRVRLGHPEISSSYFYYYLGHPSVREYIVRHAHGATMPNLNTSILRSVPLVVPPLDEQRRIAAVLGALDDKIELNRKMNRTLEEMAQAIFKSWFIDFDGVPESEMVDSELGPIPKGWRWVPFADCGRWVSGGTPSKKRPDYWKGTIPWFSAKSMGPVWLFDSEDRVTEVGADHGTRRVPRRTVLFIVRGMSLAQEWRIGITAREATLNQDLKGIVDDGTVVPELLLLWILHNRETIRLRADEAGHGTKRLPTTVLHSFSMAMPSRRAQEEMAAVLTPLLSRIEVNQAESRTLAELRDTLLPKLISGELRVPEAEELAESVL